MIAEARISHHLGLLDATNLELILNLLQPLYPPVGAGYEELQPYLRNDKKNTAHSVNFSLLNQLGGFVINKVVEPSLLRQALIG